MTGKKLLEAIGGIEEGYIEEYQGITSKKATAFRGVRRHRKVLAAVIILVILVTGIMTVSVRQPTVVYPSFGGTSDDMSMAVPYRFSYTEYCRFLQIYNPEADVTRYHVLAALGEFSCYWIEKTSHVYELNDPKGVTLVIYTEVSNKPSKSYTKLDALPEGRVTMRHLGSAGTERVYYEIDGVTYYYEETGRLSYIQVTHNAEVFKIYLHGKDLAAYPQDQTEDLLLEQLLSGSLTTVKAGISRLKAALDRGWAITRLEHWWFSALPGVAVVLGLLLIVAPVTVNGILAARYQKKHGQRLQLHKKRFWLLLILTMLGILFAMLLFDTYTLPNYKLPAFTSWEHLKPVRLVPVSFLQTLQLREGMDIRDVISLLGAPQTKETPSFAQWELLFGGTLTVNFQYSEVSSWNYSAFTSINGWILPGVLLLVGLLGLCFYLCCFHPQKWGKKCCIAGFGLVLAMVFGGMVLVNAFVLPRYDGHNYDYIQSRILFFDRLPIEQVGEGMTRSQVYKVLGTPSREYQAEGGFISEWDMPLGMVYRIYFANIGNVKWLVKEKGVCFFASAWGFVAPWMMLITLMIELWLYGYLYHGTLRDMFWQKDKSTTASVVKYFFGENAES